MWIEAFRHDALTPIFKALTFTGEPTFFLLVFSVGYWLFDRRRFADATLLLLAVALINSVLKAVFEIPRPDSTFALASAHGWSFPSGHAMVAAAVWPWLALDFQQRAHRKWAMSVAFLLALGVALSRVYLGVHSLRDVGWGLLIGGLILGAAKHGSQSPPTFWARLGDWPRFGFLTTAVLSAVFLFPIYDQDTTGAKAGGALVALWIGIGWTQHRAAALPQGIWVNGLAALIGLAGTFGLRWGVKVLLLETGLPAAAPDFLRYGLIGLWIAAGAPWLFQRLGLTGTPSETGTANP